MQKGESRGVGLLHWEYAMCFELVAETEHLIRPPSTYLLTTHGEHWQYLTHGLERVG